jgi:hypothetical protein
MNEMYFFEYMMENVAVFSPIISALNILSVVFVILYMHYTAKYKNQDLSVAWYIFGFFFDVPTAIVFAVKSKKFRHENTKVCSQCGDKYPETFSMCSRCLIDLPELDDQNRMKKKKLGKIFCILFWVVSVISVVVIGMLMATVVDQTIDLLDESFSSHRIGFTDENGETVYYDKEGNTYTDPNAVLIYGKNGEVYTYTTIEDADEGEDAFYFENTVYIDEEGNEYDPYLCYVDEDGYFFYDENYEIVWDDSDYDYEADDEFEVDFEELLTQDDTYRYYQDRYTDNQGKLYYYADEVSWNENGEIIIAENDPNPPVAEIED